MRASVLALIAGYLLGGFPTAYLLSRLRGKDVFAVGSGSMGAMNTLRNVGTALGAAVLVVDAAKGALAVYFGGQLASLSPGTDPLLPPLLGALGAVAGHCFSPYVGFRGGKGLATAFGAVLVVDPAPALYGAALIAVLVVLLRDANVAMAATMALFPLVTLAALLGRGRSSDEALLVGGVVLAMCVVGLARLAVGRRRDRARAGQAAG